MNWSNTTGKSEGGDREKETKTGRKKRMQGGKRHWLTETGTRHTTTTNLELEGVSLFNTKGGSIAISTMFNQLFMIC